MKILALDCSTDILSVALKAENGWAEASMDLGLKHAEGLMDLVDLCLGKAGLKPQDLDCVACAAGPGSFTGLRIGMATAKGMALALGKAYVAVPTMEVLAWGLEAHPGLVVPVIDGKKGRVYSALFQSGRRISDYLDLSIGDLLGLVDSYPNVFVTGPDADMLESTASERSGFRIDPRRRQGAGRALAILAEEEYLQRGASAFEEGPLYLRSSEAEVPLPQAKQ